MDRLDNIRERFEAFVRVLRNMLPGAGVSARAFTATFLIASTLGGISLGRAATVAHWRFEEAAPGTVAPGVDSILDTSGNGLHGTPFGDPIYRMVNNPGSTVGLEFDGVDARVFIPDHVLLQLTQSLTLEVYIQIHAIPPANHDFTEIVFRGDDRGALDPYSLALIPDGRLVFHVADTFNNIADVVSPFPLPLDQPLHVAGTLDDATGAQKLFINGQEVASQVTNIRPFAMLDPLRNPGVGIGSLQSTLLPQFFDGILDEVRISNVALTPSEFLPPPLVGGVINDFVSFEPIPSTFTFTPDPTGCPEGFVGTFGFEAQLTNISTSVLSDLVVTVTTLTNGNLLLNADGGLGGGGALLTIPHKDQYGDGTLQETEFVDVPFTICLHALTPFHFFVDVLGKSRQQPQPRRTMRIQALIDGRSQLLLRGNTAQWHHFDFAAPGRHDFQNVPTVINGVVWLPVWPDQPDAENRDCDCVSDVFLGVEPPLPPTAAPVQLRTIRSRFDTQIVQQPTAANDFTLIIEFNDNPPGGDDFYIAEIDVAM